MFSVCTDTKHINLQMYFYYSCFLGIQNVDIFYICIYIYIYIYIHIWLYTECVNTNPARSIAGIPDASITFDAPRRSKNDGISNYREASIRGFRSERNWPDLILDNMWMTLGLLLTSLKTTGNLSISKNLILINIFPIVINIFPLFLNGKSPIF